MTQDNGRRRLIKKARNACLLATAALVISGCAAKHVNMFFAEQKRAEPFREVPVEQIAWRPAEAVLAMKRRDAEIHEIAFILENDTVRRGENTLLVITYDDQRPPAFEFEALLERMPGEITPFAVDAYAGLQAAEDDLGPFVWSEDLDDDAICVLAMRRLEPSQAPLEIGIGVVDVVLRNCVVGERQDALGPIALASSPSQSVAGAPRRSLSLLAAPMPQVDIFGPQPRFFGVGIEQ